MVTLTYVVYATQPDGTVEDRNDPEILLNKIEDECTPRKSEGYESNKFWTTPLSTHIDHFVAELRTKAKNCNFGELTDQQIRDKVMFTITGNALSRHFSCLSM